MINETIQRYLGEDRITDYRKSGNDFLGYCGIAFRQGNNPQYDINKPAYVCNATGDGWFRKTEGVAKGYGLAINWIKITSRKDVYIGGFKVYKARIEYIDDNTEEAVEDNFWVYLADEFEIEEVLTYIRKNQAKWYP